MIEFNNTFFIQLANFLITLVVLNYLLIKPIRNQIRNRQDLTNGYLSDIEHFSKTSAEKLSTYEAALDVARTEATSSRDAIKQEGLVVEQASLAKAQSEALQYIKQAKEQTAAQTQEAMAALQKQIPGFADSVVSKILG